MYDAYGRLFFSKDGGNNIPHLTCHPNNVTLTLFQGEVRSMSLPPTTWAEVMLNDM